VTIIRKYTSRKHKRRSPDLPVAYASGFRLVYCELLRTVPRWYTIHTTFVPPLFLVSRMPAQLLALNEGPSILLDKPILLVGRHQECDIQLPSRKISRRHCCIAQVKDYLVVRDLASTNGIRINGARVVEGCVRPGDELAIADFRYRLCCNGVSDGGVPPPFPQAANPPAQPMPPQPCESCDIPIPLDEPTTPGQPPPPRALPAGVPPTAFTAGKPPPAKP
jgi:FHA domain